MMEQGDRDQFWGVGKPLATDWRTRRAQQDAYRKALDEQIQQRKMIELKEKVKETPQPEVKDPVHHLMPWLANSTEGQSQRVTRRSPGCNNPNNILGNDVDKFVDAATVGPPPPLQASNVAQPKYTPPQEQTYFYGPPSITPGSSQVSLTSTCDESRSSSNDTPPPAVPFPSNVAYGYYQSSSIPPPPAYTEPNSYRPDYPYKTNNQNPALNNHNGASTLQQDTFASQSKLQTLQASEKTQFNTTGYSTQDDTARSTGKDSIASSSDMSIRRHVSQTSEDAPCQTKSHYRDELSRQIEERKKFDDERKRQEKQEEERLQRKVQEDQERMTREYEEEQRRRKAKEEEKRQQEQDILERTREAQQQEEVRRKQEKEEKRRLKENTLKAEASERLKTSMLSTATVDNPFDSTPIRSSFSLKAGHGLEGQGDSEVIVNTSTKARQIVALKPLINHDDVIASVEIGHDILPPKRMTSGLSKSSEECSITPSSSSSTDAEVDVPICSKCSKSYSSDDIKLRKEAEEKQLEGVNFLNKLRSVLVAEKEKVDQRIKTRKESEDASNAKCKRSECTVQF